MTFVHRNHEDKEIEKGEKPYFSEEEKKERHNNGNDYNDKPRKARKIKYELETLRDSNIEWGRRKKNSSE